MRRKFRCCDYMGIKSAEGSHPGEVGIVYFFCLYCFTIQFTVPGSAA